jgi:hypothetical protein
MDAQRLHDTLKAGETAVVLVKPGHPKTARMALGVKRGLWMETASQDADAQIDAFLAQADGPVFGWLGYDLKNAFERLDSRFEDRLGFGALGLFEPIETGESAVDFGRYRSSAGGEKKIQLTPRISKQQYLDDVRALQEHIQRGDIYERARPRRLVGLVPRQATTGGKPKLLGITKRGSRYLRRC